MRDNVSNLFRTLRSLVGASQNLKASLNARRARIERLEDRALLSVSPVDYAAIREAYPAFDLPEDQALVATFEIEADALSVDSLRAALDQAASSEQDVNLIVVRTTETSNTITFGENDETFDVGVGVTLVGYGDRALTIDGADTTSLFSVSGGDFNFGGLTFKNGLGDVATILVEQTDEVESVSEQEILAGGAVLVENAENVAFVNCSFENNGVVGTNEQNACGGAVFVDGAETLTIQNCSFTENFTQGVERTAKATGGATTRTDLVTNNGSGGALYAVNLSSISLTNSSFQGNSSGSGGGVYAEVGKLAIQDCSFDANVAENSYESVYVIRDNEGAVSMASSVSYQYGEGGAASIVASEEFSIANSDFTENQSVFGGAIFGYTDKTDVKDSNFSSNVASTQVDAIVAQYYDYASQAYEFLDYGTYFSGCGGAMALSAENETSIANTTFLNNMAGINGGAFYGKASEISVSNCNVSGNAAGSYYEETSASYYEDGTTEQEISLSSSNGTGGGAFDIVGDVVSICDCVFSNNSCEVTKENAGGAAIRSEADELTIQDSRFRCNAATSCDEGETNSYDEDGNEKDESYSYYEEHGVYGGAVYSFGSKTSVSGSFFQKNVVRGYGGALFCTNSDDAESLLTLTKCEFEENSATETGASQIGSETSESQFAYTRGYGGAVYGDVVEIADSIFQDNQSVQGGAVNGLRVTVVNSRLTGNQAIGTQYTEETGYVYYGQGGAVYTDESLTVKNTTIADNAASCGGGAYVCQRAELYNTILVQNQATEEEGGNDVYADSSSEAELNAYNVLSSYVDWSNADEESVVNYQYDPNLPLFADDSCALAEKSQAIDKGNDQFACYDEETPIVYDLTEHDRVCGLCVDLGACEYIADPEQLQTPGLTLDSTASSSVSLTIKGVENASGYVVKYSTNSKFTAYETQEFTEAGDVTVTSLTPNKKYYFRVQAVGDGCYYYDSEWSGNVSTTTLVKLASPKVTVDSSKTTGNSVALNIGRVTNATSYVVTVKDSAGVVTTQTTKKTGTFVLNELSPKTTYSISVVAKGNAKKYEESDASEVEAKTINLRLTAPTISVASISHDSITVKVSAVDGASGYGVKIATNSALSKNVKTVSFDGTEYTITGLKSNTKYYLGVQALGDGDNYADSAWSTKTVNATTSTLLDAPSVTVDAEKATDNSVALNIGKVKNATSYVVTVSDQSGVVATKTTKKNGAFVVDGLHPRTTYSISVVAQGDAKRYETSEKSTVEAATINTRLKTPSLSVASTSHNSISVKVSETTGATGYKVKFATDSKLSKNVGTVSFDGTQYTITGLKSNAKYYLVVQAIGDGDDYADSTWSTKATEAKTLVQLATPTISVKSTTDATATVNIGRVSNASQYVVEYTNQSTGETSKQTFSKTGTQTIKGLEPGTKYGFTVYATGKSSYAPSDVSAVVYATTTNEKLTSPTVSTSTQGTRSVISVEGDARACEGYSVEISISSNFSRVLYSFSLDEDGFSYDFDDLGENAKYLKNRTFYFRVRANATEDLEASDWVVGSIKTTKSISGVDCALTNQTTLDQAFEELFANGELIEE